MVDQWAVLTSTGLIFIALGIIVFYLIPLQAKLYLTNKDYLSGLRLRLLLASSFIAIAASPVIVGRVLRQFNIVSVLLNDVITMSIGLSFLAFSIALVSVYHYKKKE